LGYVLGPRINAGGRVGDSSLGYRLLCSKDDFSAQNIAEELDTNNAKRKDIEAYVLLNAVEMLEATPQKYSMTFAYGYDWHQGVIGIVAGKLKERYNLPSFVMSVEADEVKGSARSVDGLDIGALIMAAKEKGILTKGGGHVMAAGFSLKEENIEIFKEFAGDYIHKHFGQTHLSPVIEIDAIIDITAAGYDFASKLSALEPYGTGNAEPKFLLNNVKIVKSDIIGSGHVRCFLSSGSGGNVKAIAFRAADNEIGRALLTQKGELFGLVGVLRVDNWQGHNQVQFIIEDAMRSS
jgi:single-stranded-DNA-specific exonuclease